MRSAVELGYQQFQRGQYISFLRSFNDAQFRKVLYAATAVIYTPAHEHFGIVPLEAMAAYRPVIAVSSGGPLESVKDGVTGFLRPAEPAAFASAMHTLVTDPSLAVKMGKAGAQHVAAKFSREALGKVLDTMCKDMTASASASAAVSITSTGAREAASATTASGTVTTTGGGGGSGTAAGFSRRKVA